MINRSYCFGFTKTSGRIGRFLPPGRLRRLEFAEWCLSHPDFKDLLGSAMFLAESQAVANAMRPGLGGWETLKVGWGRVNVQRG